MLANLLTGFSISFSLHNILYCFIGCTLGQIIGVLPGLGPTATIALLLSLTYKLDLTSSIIMLAGIWYGSMYGGTVTSVLLKIPGEPSSVMTCVEGYEMALQGRAGKALGIAAFGSFIAGTFGTLMLSLLAPPLSRFAILFGPPEYTALMILGLTLVLYLSSGSTVKAIQMGVLGLAIGTIGMDPVNAVERFTFGAQVLMERINIATVAMGLFGIAEVLYLAESTEGRSLRDAVRCPSRLRDLLPDARDWRTSLLPIARGSVLGFFIGMIPGGGATISSFASYAMEKKFSRDPSRFGKGAIEGVAGPESANNSASTGTFVPLLTLGIPTNAAMALLMGAFMIHGVIPGPFVLEQHREVFWGIVTSMYIGNAILLILNIPLIRIFVKILDVPASFLSPLIVTICMIGAYSVNNNPDDVVVMLVFGGLGYFMKKMDYEPAPLILAYVLGPILEKSLRQSLIKSQGSISIFWTRPIPAVLLGAAALLMILPVFSAVWKRPRGAQLI